MTGARWRQYFCEGRSDRAWAVQTDLRFSVDKDQLTQHMLAEIGQLLQQTSNALQRGSHFAKPCQIAPRFDDAFYESS
jgi:hypothetical protein